VTVRRASLAASILVGAWAAAMAGCQPAPEGHAGLLVTVGGSLSRLDADGSLDDVPVPAKVRHVAAAGGSVVVATDDGQFLVASPIAPAAGDLPWRPLAVDLPPAGFTAGIDVSPDGRSLAVVEAAEDADRLDLVTVDLASGGSETRGLDLRANGPPSWLTSDTLALEVIGRDDRSGLIALDTAGGEPDASESHGFALAATPDGRTIAVADDAAGAVVVRDRAAWWSDAEGGGDPGLDPEVTDVVQDVAIDADGGRVAVVYAGADTPEWTLAVYRLGEGRWERITSTEVTSDAPPTIDWLE
jgi:hypothetical protein